MEEYVSAKIEEYNISNKVSIVKQTNDMANYYHKADIYIFPSNYEGLGITAIEAQACGVICLVSSNVPSAVDCGMTVFFSLEKSAAEWAYKLDQLLSSERKMNIDSSKLYFYSIQNTVEQIDEIYK